MARRIAKPAAPTSVEAVRHTGDSRVNIPTAETQSLAEAEQAGPQTLRYPRDPSLDPQLVWKGKDEQDGEDLVVPALPIHILDRQDPRRHQGEVGSGLPRFECDGRPVMEWRCEEARHE